MARASAKRKPTEDNKPPLLRKRDGPIAILTLDRPESLNTLSQAMMAAISRAIADLGRDATVRAIVLTATGKAFSAGHDLREMSARRSDADGGRAYFTDLMSRCATMMQGIVACPKPVLAAVQASAVAAGCQLVATCDLAVAATDAMFGTTGINNGLFCATPMVPLSRNVPRKRALEMLLIGDLISAADAERYGLVNGVVPGEEVLKTALGLAHRIASKSPAAIAFGKRAYYAQIERGLAAAYDLTANVMVDNLMLEDACEGIGAFLEKRKPTWKGR